MNKPEYRIPTMKEISDVESNGFNVISTFSGCGGSSLGYKMAGFKVLWANEFIPIAAETYRLNHDGIVNESDIRELSPEQILEEIGLEVGALDILDGSPPCASFSSAGKRDKKWGQVVKYSETKQRVDDLFFEFARILRGLQPKVFVAENVKGLISGKAKGYFKDILAELQSCGYVVKAALLDAQWLGVPQRRERLFFIGVRNDLHLEPVFPKPLGYSYTVRDAIPWIVKQGDNGGFGKGRMRDAVQPSPTIGTGTQTGNGNYPPSLIEARTGNNSNIDTEKRKLSIAELKRICAFPADFKPIGTFAQQWERLGRAVPPIMMFHIASTICDQILCKQRLEKKPHVC